MRCGVCDSFLWYKNLTELTCAAHKCILNDSTQVGQRSRLSYLWQKCRVCASRCGQLRCASRGGGSAVGQWVPGRDSSVVRRHRLIADRQLPTPSVGDGLQSQDHREPVAAKQLQVAAQHSQRQQGGLQGEASSTEASQPGCGVP